MERRKGAFPSRLTLVTVDVGNTSISIGAFKYGRLVKRWHGSVDGIPQISRFVDISGGQTEYFKVVISSVSPKSLRILIRKWSKSLNQVKILLIGRHLKPRFKHKYRDITKLGNDRAVNLYGGMTRFKRPFAIFDFGTATTVDVVSKSGVYEGGLIIPGIEISFQALQEKAALLPRMRGVHDAGKPWGPKNSWRIGRDTEACMRLGLLQGFSAMVDGLIERYRKQFGRHLSVVACGGLAKTINSCLKHKMVVDQDHTLKSLALIYQDACKSIEE